jgi:hypothetical protein
MLEPILDDEDDEGISDDEGLFTLTDQTPTAGTCTTPHHTSPPIRPSALNNSLMTGGASTTTLCTESLARRRAELTWKGEITEKVYRALLKQHKTERRLRRLAEQVHFGPKRLFST